MADNNLRIKVKYDDKEVQSGAPRTSKAVQGVNKSVKNQGQAFTQLAYALDDAQYGFRGVQNNLQAIAVTAGASGPIVLGITALTVGLGYAIENWENFGDAGVQATNAINKAWSSSQTDVAATLINLSIYEKTLKAGSEWAESSQYAFEKIEKSLNRAGSSTAQLLNFTKAQAKLKAVEGAVTSLISDELGYQIRLQQGSLSLWEKLGVIWEAFKDDPLGTLGAGIRGIIPPNLGEVLVEELEDSEERVADFVNTASDLVDGIFKDNEGLAEFLAPGSEEVKNAEKRAEEFAERIKFLLSGDSKESSLITGITSLGTAIGNALANGTNVAENAGKALLGVLGDLAIKIGKIILATGIGLEGLKGALTNPFTAGPAAIATGVLLIGAGAALKGLAGGSGARGSSGGSPVAGSRPVERVADTTSAFGGNVTFEIGNDALVGQLQQASDRRGTTHGSSRLIR